MNHAVPEPPVRNDWPTTANDPLMARIGATVIWETQVDYLISVVARRMYEMEQYYVVAVEDGMTSWFNKYETLLDSEFDSLHQINDSSEGEAQRLQIKREILEKRNAQSRAENRRWGGWGGWENYPKL